MKAFLEPVQELTEYWQIKEAMKKKGGVIQISGCIDAAKPHMFYSLSNESAVNLIITYSEQRAREFLEEYKFFDSNCAYYPAKDILFYQSDVRGNILTKERIAVLKMLEENQPCTIITTFDGLMDRLIPPKEMWKTVRRYHPGDQIDTIKLKEELISMGYEKTYQVDSHGQFAIRGGILDIFSLSEDYPYRIELMGDEIDSIRSFDTQNQRSLENLQEIVIYPAAELILDQKTLEHGIKEIEKEGAKTAAQFFKEKRVEECNRLKLMISELKEEILTRTDVTAGESFLNYFYKDTVSFLDYFRNENTIIYLDEPARLAEKGRVIETEFSESMKQRLEKGYCLSGQASILFSRTEVIAMLERRGAVALTTLELNVDDIKLREKFNITTRAINSYNHSFELLVQDMKQYRKKEYRTILVSGSRTRAKRLQEDLMENGVSCFYTEDYDHEIKAGEVLVCYGKVKKGYEYPLVQFAVVSESDIFGAEKARKKPKRTYEGEKIQDFTQLKPGDYVVHENHGLGIYKGIEKVEIDKVTKDYIKIEYDKGGSLFIQASSLDMLQKYAGSDAKKPKLNRLGSQEWNKTKTRVKGAVKEIAKELVELYAIRDNMEGFVYGPDTVWQREFEELFPFEETEDQELAIAATKRDMESTKNMDRLICGDVGFGKTEIAIRAAFKAVQEGKQVAYLVPTTILAQQHYNTFTQRMKDFPVRVDLLCRFRSTAQQKKTIEDLKKGQVDIVIGTHRLLSKDIGYRDLGLLIIDEEQRFGVTHKEKIKQMKNRLDVLTLTATPIPRTLHMSLIGIRDMSILEEAPIDRMPVQTYVMEYNEEMVREAVTRELARGGQVFYVFNRVKQIEDITAGIAKLVPNAVVAYAHGQMRERELEDIMYQFINGDIDVLVSTTIIETGLDISNVNTMIIHDADNMGLAQLYQLRGRVGRSNRTAYAFLMYKQNKLLKEIAEKRLSAIKEFTELGSGFKIALKDLEIRGAGNLLGAMQHGHMEAVGYDLYCKMLNEAVKQLKGVAAEDDFETVIDLNVNAFIPVNYIPNEIQKLDIYKRIAGIETVKDEADMQDELWDRFGDIPDPVATLLTVARMKAQAHRIFFTEIAQKQEEIRFTMYEKAKADPGKIPEFIQLYNGAMKFNADLKRPCFIYNHNYNSKTAAISIVDSVQDILTRAEEILIEAQEEKIGLEKNVE
ncbi:MAG: transcription-repair coupling factor [Lachnospiraceae bacterium]